MIGIMYAVVLLGLLFSGFFSGAETGLYRINRLRLHLGVQRRDPRCLRLASVVGDQQGALSMTLIGTNVANYVTTTAVAFLLAEEWKLSETNAELYTVVLLTPIVFVFGEVVPKNLFRLHADRLMGLASGLLVVAYWICRWSGLVWTLKQLAVGINRITGESAGQDDASGPKRRVAMLLQEALAGGALAEDQSDLVDRVCRLSETPLFSVMVPRNRVVTVDAQAQRRDLLRIIRRTGHARLPVFDGSRRSIIGLIKTDELLQDAKWDVVVDRLRPALTVSPHDTVASALSRLQKEGRGMAVVVDRGGRMLGLVTLKDLLREVVGDVASAV